MEGVKTLALVDKPEGAIMVPCPYCHLEGNHTGNCQLSFMMTGEFYVVFAVPGKKAAAWPRRDGVEL